jgi:hypothetical protein
LGHSVTTSVDQVIPVSTPALAVAFAMSEGLPVYTSREALTGSAILLALCLIGLVTVAVARWRRR